MKFYWNLFVFDTRYYMGSSVIWMIFCAEKTEFVNVVLLAEAAEQHPFVQHVSILICIIFVVCFVYNILGGLIV